MKKKRVLIVGGGASGLVAAIAAAKGQAAVTLLEQKNRLGKKILSTGNGKCNLTNEHMTPDCFRGDDTAIVKEVLQKFGFAETVHFFEESGVLLKSRNGYLYPISEQASAIADILTMEVERLGVDIQLEQRVTSIQKRGKEFLVQTETKRFFGDTVILATGGKAASVLGSDGSGYSLARSFGHSLSPVVPALVQLKGAGNYFKQVAGVRTNATVSLYVDGKQMASDTGELQLTNYGISGIPVFQVSRFAAKALYEKKEVSAELDFFPAMCDGEFQRYMRTRLHLHGERSAEQFLIGMFPQKLAGMLLKQAQIPLQIKANEIREEKWNRLLELCRHFQVNIEGTNSFEQAQICAGGVRTTEVNPQTLESIYEKGIYLTGELLDIDGICGGYNLQWAWATGYIAGKCAAKGAEE